MEIAAVRLLPAGPLLMTFPLTAALSVPDPHAANTTAVAKNTKTIVILFIKISSLKLKWSSAESASRLGERAYFARSRKPFDTELRNLGALRP